MQRCMADCVRRRTDGREDAKGAMELVAMIGENLLNVLLVELYPSVRPFVEYTPKQSHWFMT